MISFGKKSILLLLILVSFFISGLWIAKNINNNQIPKSAKLVMYFIE